MTEEEMSRFHEEIRVIIHRQYMGNLYIKCEREMDRIGEEWQA